MKNYTVKCKVVLEVEVPVELEDDNTTDPSTVAMMDLQTTSISDWYQRLSADYDIYSIEATEVIDHTPTALHSCEECGVALTFDLWPEDEPCPVCNSAYEDLLDL